MLSPPNKFLKLAFSFGSTPWNSTDTVYLEPGAYGQLPSGEKFLRRHFVVKTQNNPAGTKRARLYFTVQEFNDFKEVAGISTIADLSVIKYQENLE